MYIKSILLLLLCLISLSCKTKKTSELVHQQLMHDIDRLVEKITLFKKISINNTSEKNIQKGFLSLRNQYKKIEFLSEYYFPTTSKAINGAAIDEYEEESQQIESPEGFQVIEEYIFPKIDSTKKQEIIQQITLLETNIKRLKKLSETTKLTDAHIFEAMRLEIFRIITLGITGFDSPVAQNSIHEAKSALESLENYLKFYQKNLSEKEQENLFLLFKNAQNYLNKNTNFNAFNRAEFIQNFLNPISENLLFAQKELNIEVFKEKRALKTTVATIFEEDAFDIDAFSAFSDYKTTDAKIDLGKELFYDPILSNNNTRACASCHQINKAFTDNLTKAKTFDGKGFVKRNTPTILNVGFQRTLFYDSRVSYLEDQTADVIANKNEMHGSLKNTIFKFKKSPKYIEKFNKAFPQDSISAFAIKNSLAAYMRSLSKLNSRFDDYFRGNKNALTKSEINGFNIFSGKAKCATCHFIPLTNGTVPPNFDKSESEVLGVPNATNKLDNDAGKYELTKVEIHKNSFKTPTLRNIAETAPYMHNGVYKTLEEVIDFYDQGGGIGLGFHVPNQTLPEENLHLTQTEKQNLIAFLKSLSNKK